VEDMSMILVWGYKGYCDLLGYILEQCPQCRATGLFAVKQVGKKFTVYFIPTFSYSSKQYAECSTCHSMFEIPPEQKQRVAGTLKMAVCFIHLAHLVAAADGAISSAEIQAIYSLYRRQGADQDCLTFFSRLIREATRRSDYEKTFRVVNDLLTDLRNKLSLCDALLAVAVADGPINAKERAALVTIMQRLGLSEQTRNTFWRSKENIEDRHARAFAILGLPCNASPANIKDAYRRLAKQYHPDKVFGLGHAFAELADERFRSIKEAYETLANPTPTGDEGRAAGEAEATSA
jgi:DnaJ like chaperone protein